MQFDINKSIQILSKTPQILEVLLSDISDDWVYNNEGEDTWSPYDVLGHLIHGEKTDWITRAKIILSDTENKTFESFDRFAQMEDKAKNSMADRLQEFKQLRAENLETLKALELDELKLIQKGIHPELGEVKLVELLSCWTVHDLGHFAQISRVMAKQYKTEVGPWIQYLTILK